MNPKIKVSKVQSYTTTDDKIFIGKKAKSEAEGHQLEIDKKASADEFAIFTRKIFGIKCEYDPNGVPEEEEDFCDNMMEEVNINADGGDFDAEVSGFILDLFWFIGPERWQQIHAFLTKKRGR